MNILVLPQYSMRSYSDGKWLLRKDPNLKLMEYFCKAIDKNYNFMLALPDNTNKRDLLEDSFFNNCASINIEDHGFNALSQRYNFSFETFKQIVEVNKIDMVLCPAEKASYFRMIKPSLKIISFIHYLDFYTTINQRIASKYFLRDLDGAINSDLVYFNTEWNKDDFLNHEYINWDGKIEELKNLSNKSKVLGMFYSQERIDKSISKTKFDKYTILFISRLTDTVRTKSNIFIDVAEKLLKNNDIDIIFTDPNYSTDSNIKSRFKFMDLEGSNFYKVASMSHIIPVMYPLEKWASVGIIEALASGAIPIGYGNNNEKFEKALLSGKTNMSIDIKQFSLEFNKDRILNEISTIL